MCGRLSILGLAAVVIVTVYKDTRGRARAAGDHSLLRSGLIFIRSVLNFSPSNSDTDIFVRHGYFRGGPTHSDRHGGCRQSNHKQRRPLV